MRSLSVWCERLMEAYLGVWSIQSWNVSWTHPQQQLQHQQQQQLQHRHLNVRIHDNAKVLHPTFCRVVTRPKSKRLSLKWTLAKPKWSNNSNSSSCRHMPKWLAGTTVALVPARAQVPAINGTLRSMISWSMAPSMTLYSAKMISIS